jgi:formylglycine-generating enzyme required for sulfatase activity
VSWYEAVAFCQWLSEATGEKIMLPTEAQWQYAAQGMTGAYIRGATNGMPDAATIASVARVSAKPHSCGSMRARGTAASAWWIWPATYGSGA